MDDKKKHRRGRRRASPKQKDEWTVMLRDGSRHALTEPPLAAVAEEKQLLFQLGGASEAGFVVGAGGRNTGLVLKTTGVAITVADADVLGTVRREGANVDYATRMAFSMAAGGVLRWFVTPQATARGFPPEAQSALRALADAHGCELLLLQSKRGHMCLLLVLRALSEDARGRVQQARTQLLAQLASSEAA